MTAAAAPQVDGPADQEAEQVTPRPVKYLRAKMAMAL